MNLLYEAIAIGNEVEFIVWIFPWINLVQNLIEWQLYQKCQKLVWKLWSKIKRTFSRPFKYRSTINFRSSISESLAMMIHPGCVSRIVPQCWVAWGHRQEMKEGRKYNEWQWRQKATIKMNQWKSSMRLTPEGGLRCQKWKFQKLSLFQTQELCRLDDKSNKVRTQIRWR